MTSLALRYKAISARKGFYTQLAVGILLLAVSVLINNFANDYTIAHSSASVNDIILDNLPVVSVDDIFYQGSLIVAAFIVVLGFYKPSRIPFMLKGISLFFSIRAFFMILTHLAAPLHQTALPVGNMLERLVSGSGDDLFFSGHTGFPFLMALVFWEHRWIRNLFLAAAIFFGGAALLGHLHYSIDVFSAFFISYGIYHIALKFFKKDYGLFLEGEAE